MILLNLAYIPDEVVQGCKETGEGGLEFDQPGWRKDFQRRMDAYKQRWDVK